MKNQISQQPQPPPNTPIKSLTILALVSLFLLLFLSWPKTEIGINGRKFQVEIVRTEKEREKGLSGRERICENCGMLFVFPEKGKQVFWMKGMKFNLDIVWISEEKITYIAKNVSRDLKETIRPEVLSDKVLELNAGTADDLDIEIGDGIVIK